MNVYCNIVLILVLASPTVQQFADLCKQHSSCQSCISSRPSCAWCYDKELPYSGPRCGEAEDLRRKNCTLLESPQSVYSKEVAIALSDEDKVQVTPQVVNLTLRQGQPVSFRIDIRPAKDYPVDLYYLMDLSYSMLDDLANLKNLGTELAKSMRNITKVFRLGFGSFQDKTVAPYVSRESKSACSTCRPAFGYHHALSLTTEESEFQNIVSSQSTAGNLDDPEGGFDALMQATVCEDKIGWNSKESTRRLVLLATDATSHVAGDGKLGGIVTPNDGQCHLLGNEYSKLNEQDYPSVYFLKEKMRLHGIIPILAVTQNVLPTYQALAKEWEDLGATVGQLSYDSLNVVDLVRENYQKISSTIRIMDTPVDGITVQFTAKCTDGVERENIKECNNVGIAQNVSFVAKVMLTSCAAFKTKDKSIKLTVRGYGEVQVNLEASCRCSCASTEASTFEGNSSLCSHAGSLSCGICECDPGRHGSMCECEAGAIESGAPCLPGNSSNSLVCSGNGQCICGKCVCLKRQNPEELFYGDQCQCNNFHCLKHEGKICGGPQQGTCDCGKCVCTGVWSGENCGTKNCSSPFLLEQCRDSNGLICGGKGTCDCGSCTCEKGYEGMFCSSCPVCGAKCTDYKQCVECHLDQSTTDVCAQCNYEINHMLHLADLGKEPCQFRDKDGCTYWFSFISSGEKNVSILLKARNKETDCPKKVNILAIVLSTVGGVLLAGVLALIMWKLAVMAYDRMEYKKFEKDQSRTVWEKSENPIYQPSNQKYNNPLYAGQV